jgi:hypothetical protein
MIFLVNYEKKHIINARFILNNNINLIFLNESYSDCC